MPTFSYWTRTTSSSANADTLVVVGSQPATQITFTTNNPLIPGADDTGDLTLESAGGAADPDTWVVINGQTYSFTYDIVGNFPQTGQQNDGKVPVALRGKQIAVIQTSVGNYFFVLDGSGTQTLMNAVGNGNLRLQGENGNPPPIYVCFCSGTLIATPSGSRTVETLVAGDLLLTASGESKQIIWIGATHVSLNAQRASARLCPVMIPAHAFGRGLPTDDLYVSPQHRVLIEGPACELFFGEPAVLVAAKYLVDTFAELAAPVADLQYFHILMADHDMLLSNGLPTESFQPARRTMDVMGADARQMLEAVIATLGEEALLSRKDSFLSLRQSEAEVLLNSLQGVHAGRRSASATLHAALN